MKFVAIGAALGLLLGALEALVSAIGATPYWERVSLHYGQLGFAGPGLGAAFGWIVHQRRERRRAARRMSGRCPTCNYDLHRNNSGRCPECGEATAASNDPH